MVLIDGHWQELSSNMHILGPCSTRLGGKRFPVILLHYESCRWYARIGFLAKSPCTWSKIVAFDGKCQERLFGMHIMGVQSTWLGRGGPRVILLHHESRISILQLVITQQPIGAACSSRCRSTALLAGQPGLGYQSLAPQLLGFFSACSRSC